MPHHRFLPRTLLALLALCAALASGLAHAGQTLVIGSPCLTPNDPPLEFEAALTEAYNRVGISVSFRRLPMVRDLTEANRGFVDGCLGRTQQSLVGYPNLVPVPTPLGRIEVVALSLDPAVAEAGPGDLADMRIGVVHGDAVARDAADTTGGRVFPHSGLQKTMENLEKGRLDVVVIPRAFGLAAAASLGLEVTASPPLAAADLHHVVHSRNAYLVPRLDAALKAMHADGTMARLMGQYRTILPR